MSKKPEMETATIQVPKAIMDFLRHVEVDVQKYLEQSLIAVVHSDLNNDQIWGPQKIAERFNLSDDIFKLSEN